MTDVESKKAEIASLWGIPTAQIEEKLNTIKLIITDSTDSFLLELLLRFDLDIETAIEQYFDQKAVNSSPSDTEQKIDEVTRSLSVASIDRPAPSSNNRLTRRRRRNAFMTNGNSINGTSMDCDREGSADPPRRKKRKLNRSEKRESDETSNSNNHNTNSNSSSSIHNDSDTMDVDAQSIATSKVDRNWTEKKMGTLSVVYEDIREQTESSMQYWTSRERRQYNFYVQRAQNLSEWIDFARHCYNRTVMSIISTEPSLGNNRRNGHNSLFHELRRNHVMTGAGRNGVKPVLSKRKRESVDKASFQYAVNINISFLRLNTATTAFAVQNPLCIAAFSNSDELKEETLKCHNVVDEYQRKEHVFSLPSLLDFACRKSHDANDRSDNYNHGLNVTLHQYQLQSLKWMMEEENDPTGFYRKLYYKGCFGDDGPFIFSPVFNRLIFDGTIPVAHGGLLCEEMGLGKTIISLALIHAQKPRDLSGYSTEHQLVESHKERVRGSRVDRSDRQNPRTIRFNQMFKWYKSAATLIIAPCSLVGQWETECDERSEGRLKWKRYYGPNRSRKVEDYVECDIVLTTYGIMANEIGDDRKKHVLHQIEWNRIILDESHSIKNKQCVQSKSILALRGRNRWCLTGTPFGTNIADLENQLRFIGMKSEDINQLQLKRVVKDKIFRDGHSDLWLEYLSRLAEPVLNCISRVMMRHKKDQKFNDESIVSMPQKEENEILIEFTASQRIYYEKLLKIAKERYNYYSSIHAVSRASLQILSSLHPARAACSGFVCSKDEIEEKLSSAEAQSFHIRSMVKSMANKNVSSKELFEMAAEKAFADQDGECPICFECPLDDPLQTPCRHLFCGECIMDSLMQKSECPMCRGRVNPKDLKKPKKESKDDNDEVEMGGLNEDHEAGKRQHGNSNGGDDDIIRFDAKINRLMTELTKIKRDRPNEKSLIFTSFSKSLDWICSELKRNGFSYRTLTGNMTMNKRKKQMEQFANDNDVKVFVLTVRAGAVGITLTAANHVFVMEPTLNPALHRQAINRVYRLGQKRKVTIHTMIMRDSIENRIWNVIHKANGSSGDEDGQNGNNVNDVWQQSARRDHIAGNINSDRRPRLESSVIDQLFQ